MAARAGTGSKAQGAASRMNRVPQPPCRSACPNMGRMPSAPVNPSPFGESLLNQQDSRESLIGLGMVVNKFLKPRRGNPTHIWGLWTISESNQKVNDSL